MLLQTNSYIVPREKRVEHARLLRRFRQALMRLGCDHFEVYEQAGPNWSSGDNSGRFVQIMRFKDRKHQLAVQNAERTDATAQALLKEFCDLINLPYQQEQGLFAVGFYTGFMRMPDVRHSAGQPVEQTQGMLAGEETATAETPDAENSMETQSVSEAQGQDEQNQQESEESILSESRVPENGDLPHEAENIAPHDAETQLSDSNFGAEDDGDFEIPSDVPTTPAEENDRAENPTFPFNS